MRRARRRLLAVALLTLLGPAVAALALHRPEDRERLRDLGALRWAVELPATVGSLWIHGEDLFVLAEDGQVRALDLGSGAVRWTVQGPPEAELVLVRGQQVLALSRKAVRCLHRGTGALLWQRDWRQAGNSLSRHVVSVDELPQGWLVRVALGVHGIPRQHWAHLLSPAGQTLWEIGPTTRGSFYLAHGLLFLLDDKGLLQGRSLEDGRIVWTAQLAADTYVLGSDGVLSPAAPGRGRALRIAAGPRIEPVRDADPLEARKGPVRCDALGCLVQIPDGWKWFEGYVQLLQEEIRVFRAVGEPTACIGCLDRQQPGLLRVESWLRDGSKRTRSAFIQDLNAHEDGRGFVQVDGRWILATAWQEEG